MGNHQIGTGATPFAISEGYHNVRTIFEESDSAGIDGVNKGKDFNSNNPVQILTRSGKSVIGAPTPEPSLPIHTANNMPIWWGGHSVAKDDADLQIDSIDWRHISNTSHVAIHLPTSGEPEDNRVSKYTVF